MALNINGRISLSDVNTLGSPLFTGSTSLVNRDKQAMGNVNPAAVASSRVCMPYETLNAALSTLAKDTTTAWTWSGTGSVWGPHRLTEFWGAYNNLPRAIGRIVPTGSAGSANLYIRLAGEYSNLSGFYAYRSSGGSFTAWTLLAAGAEAGPIAIGNGTYIIAARDFYNCGSSYDLTTSVTYP